MSHRTRSLNIVFLLGSAAFLTAIGLGCSSAEQAEIQSTEDTHANERLESSLASESSVTPPAAFGKGASGAHVHNLYKYLYRYGYFPNSELEKYPGWVPAVAQSPADPQTFDELIETAVRAFQKKHGLEVTGVANTELFEIMKKPRCSFPDLAVDSAGGGMRTMDATSRKWGKTDLRYHFTNFTPDLPENISRTLVRMALDRWAAVSPFRFTEGSLNVANVGIDYEWRPGNEFSPTELAYAFPPQSGRVKLNEAFQWTDAGSHDVLHIVLHETGHALGLGHSADPNTIMYAYETGNRWLTKKDIDDIQSMYGQDSKMQWSSAGPLSGKRCIRVDEPADPHTWNDNYLCFGNPITDWVGAEFRWSNSGPLAGWRCTQFSEGVDPHGWDNNYLCTKGSGAPNFIWSNLGPVAGKRCVQIHEFADPNTWWDNFLCY